MSMIEEGAMTSEVEKKIEEKAKEYCDTFGVAGCDNKILVRMALDAFKAGAAEGQRVERERWVKEVNAKLSEFVSKLSQEEPESRMWRYYVGAKDQLHEFTERIVKGEDE